jgi:hypothetical protein
MTPPQLPPPPTPAEPLWTYSPSRAILSRDGVFFAFVTPNGLSVLLPEQALILLAALNATPPANEAVIRQAVEHFDALLKTHDEDIDMDEFDDADSVGSQSAGDGKTVVDMPLTFGHLRRARKTLTALRQLLPEGKV